MRLTTLFVTCLSLASAMPVRPQDGQPVVHNHYNRIPNIPGLKGLQQQIMMSAHRESILRQSKDDGMIWNGYPWKHIHPKEPTPHTPTTQTPTTQTPTTQTPTTQTPTTQIPTTQTPTTHTPTTQTPTTHTPTTQTPTTQTPTTQTPTTQTPTTQPPTQTPTTQTPTTQTPTHSPTTQSPTHVPTPEPTTQAPTTQIPTTPAPTHATTPVPTQTPTTRAPTQAATQAPTSAPTTQAPTHVPTHPPTTSAPTPTLFPILSPDTSSPGSHGVAYNGGYVMTNPVTVYLVYYGSWTTTTQQQTINIINTFVTNIGNTPWWNIQTTYYYPNPATGDREYVKNGMTFGGHVVLPIDSFNGGTSLTDNNVETIIKGQITSGALPYDVDGVYMMISSSEVYETGFCTSDCGWHSAGSVSGSGIIKYGWVGDATTQCPNACTAFSNMNSPNGNKPADSIISILAHEIAESVSDPFLNGWVNSANFQENADKCAWNFGHTYFTSNGGLANMKIGEHDYLVQANWKNRDGGACVLSL